MLTNLFNWILDVTQGLSYLGVGILMTIESSFLPFPSEVIIPPAAYLASQGRMNLAWIIIAGVLGSILGAVINYLLAFYLGRPLIYKLADHRLARLIFVTPEKVARAEKYFLANSNSATLVGRLIPVIRQLISLPAGFCRMPFGRFVFLTALGSLVWISILAALGYFIGANQRLLSQYYQEISWVLLAFGIIWLSYKIINAKRRRKGRPGSTPSSLSA
ncbi:MAG: DedA family protein [Patescibacteria group bacterium]